MKKLFLILCTVIALAATAWSDDSCKKGSVMTLGADLRKDPASAEAAAKALALCGKDAAAVLPELIDALDFEEASVAAAVSEALVKIGPDSVKPLIKALSHSNFMIRQRAAETLAAFGPEARKAVPDLVEMLQDSNYDAQNAARNTLIKIGEPAVPAIAAGLKDKDPSARKSVVAFLPKFGAAATPYLVNTLQKDDSALVRVSAAVALGEIRPVLPTVVPALVAHLKHPDDNLRTAAINALGALGPEAKAAIGPLTASAFEGSEALSQQRSRQALKDIGPATKDSIPGMAQAMKSKEPDVRKAVLTALTESSLPIDDYSALLALALKDPDTGVRQQAIQITGALAQKEAKAVPLLRLAMLDGEPGNRSMAIRALGGATSAPEEAANALALGLNDASMARRQECIHALARLGPAAIPVLQKAAQDSSAILAEEAASLITRMQGSAPAAPANETPAPQAPAPKKKTR